jgi:integrase
MEHEKLSEETVKALPKPESGNRVYYFAGHKLQGLVAPRGFGVRVTTGGARSFVLNYRVGSRERRYTIGLSPDLAVIRAIKIARELRQQVDDGHDPQEAKEIARAPATGCKTVTDVLAEFVKRYVRKTGLRTADEIERTFERLVVPAIGATGIYQIRRSDVIALLDRIEDENGPVMADRVLGHLRKCFNWYAVRDDQFNSPMVKGMARTKPLERARTRILSDDEIRDLWAALDIIAADIVRAKPWLACYPRFVKTLLLTGQRREEVAGMSHDEINGDLWTLPAARNKVKVDHEVPLTDDARALIGKRDKGVGPFVFANSNGTPFSTYSKAKKVLDTTIAELRAARGAPPAERWTHHDLRRSARSLLSRAQVPADHAERTLGHLPPEIVRRYDRHAFRNEKWEALDKLAALVRTILNPPQGNVEPLDAARSKRAKARTP